jgi:hypothetical protein
MWFPGGRRFQEALHSPLLAPGIGRFNDSIRVGDDQIARIQLNDALLIVRIGEHSNRGPARFEPMDRAVISKNNRRIVSGIHVP